MLDMEFHWFINYSISKRNMFTKSINLILSFFFSESHSGKTVGMTYYLSPLPVVTNDFGHSTFDYLSLKILHTCKIIPTWSLHYYYLPTKYYPPGLKILPTWSLRYGLGWLCIRITFFSFLVSRRTKWYSPSCVVVDAS